MHSWEFPRVEAEIEACTRHVARLAALPPEHALGTEEAVEIEAFLARYLLISIYAEFEQAIDKAVRIRADLIPDESVRGFVVNAADALLRRISVSDLAGFLGRFGEECKNQFHDEVRDVHQPYADLLENRHATAHGSGSLMTLNDVCQAYEKAVPILKSFGDALAETVIQGDYETSPSPTES